MNSVKVPDLADGPVSIRHGGLDPIDLGEAKGGVIKNVNDKDLRSVLIAFPEAEVTGKSTPKEN